MEIFAAVLIVASVVLPVLAALSVLFFVGYGIYVVIAERREAATQPEPEPVTVTIPQPMGVPAAA